MRRWTWGRGQGLAFAGLMVILVLGAGSFLGAVLAQAMGITPGVGWLAGVVGGYFLSRVLLRAVIPRLLPPQA